MQSTKSVSRPVGETPICETMSQRSESSSESRVRRAIYLARYNKLRIILTITFNSETGNRSVEQKNWAT